MFVVVETLISHHSDRDDPILENIELSDPHNGHRSAENNVQEYQGGRCNCYMLSAAVMASLGGVLFGYDIGTYTFRTFLSLLTFV